jgi:hypothetical protein
LPDLEQAAVTRWLTELRPHVDAITWPPSIRSLEATGDTPQLAITLGQVLDQVGQSDLTLLANALRASPLRDDLSAVLAQLGAARVLRLLHWLSESDVPHCDAVIRGLLSGETESGRSLRAAVSAVTRRATLRRIFAPERIAALEEVCTRKLEETT